MMMKARSQLSTFSILWWWKPDHSCLPFLYYDDESQITVVYLVYTTMMKARSQLSTFSILWWWKLDHSYY